jgi:hypothetical protein
VGLVIENSIDIIKSHEYYASTPTKKPQGDQCAQACPPEMDCVSPKSREMGPRQNLIL